jgi:hypothetical protein
MTTIPGREVIGALYATARGRAEARPRSYPASPGGMSGECREAADTPRQQFGLSRFGGSTCVQSRGFQSDQQIVTAAELPSKSSGEKITAHLPLTTKAGSLAPLRDSTQASLERLCTMLQALAMSGYASDTPPTMCAPVHISSEGFSAPSMASNGSTPRWMDAQSLGGLNSKERGKLLLLSDLRKRRDARLNPNRSVRK